MEQWEYKTIRLEFKMQSRKGLLKFGIESLVENFDEKLNELGKQDWELISTIPVANPATWGGQSGYFYCIFKRKKT